MNTRSFHFLGHHWLPAALVVVILLPEELSGSCPHTSLREALGFGLRS